MIIFRQKQYSYMKNAVVQKLTTALDKDKVDSYDVSDRIPKDCISISVDLQNLEIYLPDEFEYSQYDIEGFIRKNFGMIRTSVEREGNLFIMYCRGTFRIDQYIKLVEHIIDQEGYCVIISENI